MHKPASHCDRNKKLAWSFTLLMLYLFIMLVAVSPALGQETENSAKQWLQLTTQSACNSPHTDGISIQSELPGAWFIREDISVSDRPVNRAEYIYALPENMELRLSYIRVNGALRRFTAELYEPLKDNTPLQPLMQVQTDGTCVVRSARRISRETSENIILEHLDQDLENSLRQETLQASWPAGKDSGGVRVALIDSGLAYDLPIFRDRLARDEKGIPLGYDFWDLDPLPYDGDTARNVFQPIRHGTPVASIIAKEAPSAVLIPYRYPRPDMSRMGEIINRAAQSEARIISMPLGSRDQSDWVTFETAMKANPHLLAIVSAGNNGRDIDDRPLWPGVLNLDNMIVVTSSDAFGHLANGSNWGEKSVDLMVPAENQSVIDFRGSSGQASGTSYAVPRIAALAARILEKSPNLTTPELKAAIFARAAPPRKEGLVSVGWIIDPDRD